MTTVEWLEHIYLTIGIDRNIHFKQAKEMERQQKIDFANKYSESDCIYCSGEFDIEKRADEFYDETFKKD